VTVIIRNRGPDAFCEEKYGDKIIVERTLAEKSSSYRIMCSWFFFTDFFSFHSLHTCMFD